MSTAPVEPQVQNSPPAQDTPGTVALTLPTEQWTDAQAYRIAMADFRYSETYRQQKHDRRFKISDDLYMAATVKKYWEGTKVQRSSMPVFLSLQQIEALLPHVVDALFNDDVPFAAFPMPGTNGDQARATMALISWQLANIGEDPKQFISLRELFRRGYKSDLLYGNQVVEWGWLSQEFDRLHYSKIQVPARTIFQHPTLGPIQLPTGEYQWQVSTQVRKDRISRPFAKHVDMRDCYWDPNCPSSNAQEGRYFCIRQFPTLTDLWDKKDIPGFHIPDTKKLQELVKKKSAREGDNSKRWTESSRGNSWVPTLDYSDDPAIQRIEVVRYIRKDRCIWIVPGLEGEPLYNKPNEYGMINVLTSAYTDVPGRWAGLSISDLVEGDQHLAMSILDARIDWLNLWGVHKPIVRKRGSLSAPTAKRIRPGIEWEVDGNPKEDIQIFDVPDVTAQAFVEVDAIDRRVQKTTGNSDLAVIGTASAGGNSANRSATGVQVQQAASGSRIQYQVINKEDHIFVPLLYIMHWMDKRFLDPQDVSQVLGPDAQFVQIDHVDVLNADVQFKMLGSSKMKAKQALQAGGLQTIMEMMMNPALIQEHRQAGLKPNVPAMDDLVCDALSLPKRSLWIQMSPQEIQQAAQQQNSDAMLKMMLQRERLQSADRNQDQANETTLINTILQKTITPEAAHEALGLPSPAAIEQRDNPPPKPSAGQK